MAIKYIACISRMLIRSHSVPFRTCDGSEMLRNSHCIHCEYWKENQYIFENDEGEEADDFVSENPDAVPEAETLSCGMADGFRRMGMSGPVCDGDKEMISFCQGCEFYQSTPLMDENLKEGST